MKYMPWLIYFGFANAVGRSCGKVLTKNLID